MKPMFVQFRNEEKDVRWLPLLGFAILLIVVGATIGGLLKYVLTGDPGVAAPMVGAIIGLLLAIRQISASIAYQPLIVQENEEAKKDVTAS